VIPQEQDGEAAVRMESLFDTHPVPYDSQILSVCMDKWPGWLLYDDLNFYNLGSP
jgi:hypothetical protein